MRSWGKGITVRYSKHAFRDSRTGRELVRLTGPGELSHHPYFYNRMFTADGNKLVFAVRRQGHSHLHLLDLTSGEAVQLTEGEGLLAFSANLSPDGQLLYYVRHKSIVQLHMDSLLEKTVYTTPDGWVAYDNPGLSSDGEYAITVELRESDQLNTREGWNQFEAQWASRPRCRIVEIQLASGESRVIHEEQCWLGHPQYRPGDTGTVMFCHEGPAHKVDARIWLINGDGTGLRCARPQQPGEMIGHEYWLHDGSAIAYVYRRQEHAGLSSAEVVDPETFMPITANAPLTQQVRTLDPVMLQERYVMDCSPYCHFISNHDFSLIVGDGQLEGEGFIYLADPARGTEQVLCEHGTSWKSYGTTQDAHPHPAFSPDGRRIVFTSDREGLPAVYMVELG
ncbi:MAG: oligogalacturonate lyase [Paenibacillaceae bacterium]|jgi:oligogalacturonide lyase|nr:oligogalacturonate lyase [Paenibacillaceae bacterium]